MDAKESIGKTASDWASASNRHNETSCVFEISSRSPPDSRTLMACSERFIREAGSETESTFSGGSSSIVMLALESTSTATRDGKTSSCSVVRSKSRYAATKHPRADPRNKARPIPAPRESSTESRRYIQKTSASIATTAMTTAGSSHHCEKESIRALVIRDRTTSVAADRSIGNGAGTIHPIRFDREREW